MSDDKTPQRPNGFDRDSADGTSAAPRVEVEASPVSPAQSASKETITHTVVKTKTKKAPVFIASFAGLVLGAVLVIALVMAGAFSITDNDVQAGGPAQTIEIDPEDTTLAETVASKTLPSVVSITAQGEDGKSGGIGSGVVLDDDGNILTNFHVIDGAAELAVSVNGSESREAQIVGADESSDLAVIKLKDIKDVKLTPIEVGNSDDIKVGEWVMAIGSPFGNEQSTALASTNGTSIYANMIQTDAAINPGNSGGALVNDRGELIGINSVIESYSGSSSGVGFAIPANYAIDIAEQIIDGKTPVHPYQPDDVITQIDDTPVDSADSLIIAMRSYEVGDKVDLSVLRGASDKKIKVELGSDEALQKEQADSAEGSGSGNSMTEEELLRYLEEYLGRGGNR